MEARRLFQRPSLRAQRALSIGTVAAAVSLKRAGARGTSPVIGPCHSNQRIWDSRLPGGPLTFGGLAVAGGWLLWDAHSEERMTLTSGRAERDRNKPNM
jgi:hypothetical protein